MSARPILETTTNMALREIRQKPAQAEAPGTAVIAGASLAGMMAALTLSRAALRVTMLERSDDSARTGAALSADPELLRRLTGDKVVAARNPMAPGVQTWFAIHASLRAAVEADPDIELHQQVLVESVGQDAASAWAVTSDGRTFQGDIVVGADGHRSLVRRSVAPEKPDATFAGYGIWLGLVDEAALPSRHRWPSEVAYLEERGDPFLGYPLPGPDGSVEPGSRRLGWAWYDASRNDLLRETGCVVGHVVQHSLRAEDIPDRTYRELAEAARERWPGVWRDAVLDCVARRAIIGTPVTEYVPDRLADGRLVLVGDAAHVPTPMTAKGFSSSLHDAEALAESMAGGLRGSRAAQALRTYERMRLSTARSVVQSAAP
jgi:2-polyprenyl-6-methoxyphenol hydroxylase-like FAD-dependent oxidoreductase